MKSLLVLFLTSMTFISFGQIYEYGVITTFGVTVKSSGKMNMTDSTLVFDSEEGPFNYEIVKKNNGLIYFTDGVTTGMMKIVKDSGKKKGYVYDHISSFTPDVSNKANFVMYYCQLQSRGTSQGTINGVNHR